MLNSKPSPEVHQLLQSHVGELIEDVVASEVLLFPLLIDGKKKSPANAQQHWVLLKYVKQRNAWYSYNPLNPTPGAVADPFMTEVLGVINYMKHHMRDYLKLDKTRRHPLLSCTNVAEPIPKKCPQHNPNG